MGKSVINFEVKTACGNISFKKSAKLIIYAPAPCTTNILSNSYIFSRDGFLEMIDSYDGNMLRGENIQSFHWTDVDGREYRPKASRKIERHIISYTECAPTLGDLFDELGMDVSDFEDRLIDNMVRLDQLRDRGHGYDGTFGEAFEVTIRQYTMKKEAKVKTPSRMYYGDGQARSDMSFDELADLLGIE